MTLRMKLARWIGGKELAGQDEAWQIMYDNWGLCIKDLNKSEATRLDLEDGIQRVTIDLFKHREALKAIAALETPKANATVRKMARIAREALK